MNRKQFMFVVGILVVTATSIPFVQKTSGGLDEDFIGNQYLKTSWITPLFKNILGSPSLADLDRDGDVEVFVITLHYIFCLNNDGSIRWSTYIDNKLNGRMTVADLDEDGKQDILLTGESSIVCVNDLGKILWEYQADHELGDFTPCVFDVNKDKHPEIIVSTAKTTSQPFYLDRYGNFVKYFEIPMNYTGFWTQDLGSAPVVADVDNDDNIEILYIGNDYRLHCMSLEGEEKWISPTIRGDALISTADIDGDDTLEVIIGSSTRLYCFSHTGEIEWTYQQKLAYNRSTLMDYNPVIADVDDEGGLEIVSSSYNWVTRRGQVFCLNSTGQEVWHYNASSYVGNPCVVDINNDNTHEVLFSQGNEILLGLNFLGQLMLYKDVENIIDDTPLVADIDQDNKLEVIITRTTKTDLYCFELTESTDSKSSWWTYGGSFYHHGTPDSDADFLDDLTEENIYHTDARNNDTDGDLLLDSWEIEYRLDPFSNSTFRDPDGDGYSNLEEFNSATNPRKFNNWPRFYSLYLLPIWIVTATLLVYGYLRYRPIYPKIKLLAENVYTNIRVKFARNVSSRFDLEQNGDDDDVFSHIVEDLKNGDA